MKNEREERARAIAVRMVRGGAVGAGDGDTFISRTPTITELADGLLAFADDELERAAVAALEEKVDADATDMDDDRAYNLACEHIATSIRAMKGDGK